MSAKLTKLQSVIECLNAASSASLETCVAAARLLFNSKFVFMIAQLLHNFPIDYLDKATGQKFWTGPKRPPAVADFTLDDPLHYSFIVNATALFASNYNVVLPAGWDSPASLQPLLAKVAVPAFVAQQVTIKTGENDTAVEGGADDAAQVAAAVRTLEAMGASYAAGGGARLPVLTPAEFEKDDDANHHIDVITAISNLRARNYKIPEASRHQSKLIAGKIIPAIATTTAAVAALVSIEFYKTVAFAGAAPEARLALARNSFFNLGVNVYSMSEPMPPKRQKDKAHCEIAMGPVRAYPPGFSRWDKLAVREGNITFSELEAIFKAKHGLDISMVTHGPFIIYYPGLYPAHKTGRANRPIKDVIVEVTGKPLAPGRDYVAIEPSTSAVSDGVDVIIPAVQVFFAGGGGAS